MLTFIYSICNLQFTAPDLAQIAHSFDTLEQHALGVGERASTNMDDSGTF